VIDLDALNVWCDDKLVGYLWRNFAGYIGFRYELQWITKGGFAISCTLPLREESFSEVGGVAHRFFANLLPEGNARDSLARNRKIANTDFELLREVGGECAGALSILPVEQAPSKNNNYRLLTDEELENLIAQRGQVVVSSFEDDKPRLSLSGTQEKSSLRIQGDKYFLPLRESPSSHILKFEFLDYRHVPAYETFTTSLAKQIGLPTVEICLRQSGHNHYVEIERYDRIIDKDNNIVRLHQEDFCQALGFGYDKKYQQSGGPNFAQCVELVQNVSSDPIIDTENLLRWQIFNVLAGNSDGHAKNISLLYTKNGGVRLAPFYDLICTRAIKRIDTKLAFAVAGERDPGHITGEQCRRI